MDKIQKKVFKIHKKEFEKKLYNTLKTYVENNMEKDYCDNEGDYYYMDGCNGFGYYKPRDYYYYEYDFFGKYYFVNQNIKDIIALKLFGGKYENTNNSKKDLHVMITNYIENYKDIYKQYNGMEIKKDNLIITVYDVVHLIKDNYKMNDVENIVCKIVRDETSKHIANKFHLYADKT